MSRLVNPDLFEVAVSVSNGDGGRKRPMLLDLAEQVALGARPVNEDAPDHCRSKIVWSGTKSCGSERVIQELPLVDDFGPGLQDFLVGWCSIADPVAG